MKSISTYEAKAHLSRIIAEVERTGKPVTICRNNHPVVDLVPHRESPDPLAKAPHLQGARFHGDPCAPASAEDWPQAAR